MNKYAPCALFIAVASLSATAAENQPNLKMTMSLGLQTREVEVSNPVSPYKNSGTSGTASVSAQLNPVTSLALTLSYSLDQAKSNDQQTQGTIRAQTGAVSVTRYIGSGRFVSGSLSYGTNALENQASGIGYKTSADALAAGVGITQMIPLSRSLTSSIGLSYARVVNNIDSYSNSAGTRVDGQVLASDMLSLSGGLQWSLGRWSPSLSLSVSRPSASFSLANSDQAPLGFGAGLGYTLAKDRRLNFSYGASVGQSDVRDSNLGVNLSFPF